MTSVAYNHVLAGDMWRENTSNTHHLRACLPDNSRTRTSSLLSALCPIIAELHLLPFSQWPALKNSHNTIFESTPKGTFCVCTVLAPWRASRAPCWPSQPGPGSARPASAPCPICFFRLLFLLERASAGSVEDLAAKTWNTPSSSRRYGRRVLSARKIGDGQRSGSLWLL